ncbi:MAG: 50S ribosomal protein L11 methyltransferase [Chitinispirillia bacterium]|jgi:ribosomal protein L11 methyltransferase
MKPVFCLISEIYKEDREILFGILYYYNTLGYEEIDCLPRISVKSYFSDKQTNRQAEKEIVKIFPHAKISSNRIIYQDWNKNWKDSIDPVLLTENIWVSPSWCKPEIRKNDAWIKIEPKMAFGTGRHETTKLAAQALVSVKQPEKKSFLLDIGTGSGILCFLGNILGYGMSVGIDIDLWCRNSLIENKKINNAQKKTSFVIGTIESIRKKDFFKIIVVNMIRESSEEIIKVSHKYLKKDGYLIWSGLLFDEQESIQQFLKIYGWSVIDMKNENEWLCYILRKR